VLREAFAHLDPDPVVATLEPLVTAARRERLLQVIGDRLNSVTVVMDAPHDPHNGAAVMRSCDAFGIYRLHVVGRGQPFVASNAVAKGTERWVDAIDYNTVHAAVHALEADGFELVGTHPEGKLLPSQLHRITRLALVMGNEHDGICEELSAACARNVRVPMRGFVESLNVSVTAAILLSHAAASRPGDLSADQQRRLYARALVLTVPRALEILSARGISIEPATDPTSE